MASAEGHKEDQSWSMKTVIASMKIKWPKDTRPPEEYEISHLEGAVKVDPSCNDIYQTCQLIKEKRVNQVVCYCSVGYRSSKYATHLQEHLKTNPLGENAQIHNLEGSIFKWANEGRPMVDMKGEPTPYCHPYSIVWGKVLKSELRKWSQL